MRWLSVLINLTILVGLLVGCAHASENPVTPDGNNDGNSGAMTENVPEHHDPHRLWGKWSLYFNEDHTKVDLMPVRGARLHLNTMMFLEEYCSNCLKIQEIKNNGDGTINLTVNITHPFQGYPEYTGFDVKGILMFEGSYQFPLSFDWVPLPKPYFLISWREMGDPEVLNADGYTPRWSPWWDSGSAQPIFNYWPGRFSSGLPTAHLNAYLDFYTDEQRHMFETGKNASRTYKIWLPPGEPTVVGYAIEACWEPPINTPVTDPINDFPLTANQSEPYVFKVVMNNGQIITDCDTCCGVTPPACSDLFAEQYQWGGCTSDRIRWVMPDGYWNDHPLLDCEPSVENSYYIGGIDSCAYGNGVHRCVAYNLRFDGVHSDIAYDIFDFTVNDPEH